MQSPFCRGLAKQNLANEVKRVIYHVSPFPLATLGKVRYS